LPIVGAAVGSLSVFSRLPMAAARIGERRRPSAHAPPHDPSLSGRVMPPDNRPTWGDAAATRPEASVIRSIARSLGLDCPSTFVFLYFFAARFDYWFLGLEQGAVRCNLGII
jgi:hypothetical protein